MIFNKFMLIFNQENVGERISISKKEVIELKLLTISF